MQKVEVYYSANEAKLDMENWMKNGWKVHTCTMGTYMSGYAPREKVLVVYERI